METTTGRRARRDRRTTARAVAAGLAATLGVVVGVGLGPGAQAATRLPVVAAENQYGSLLTQIGGPYVRVTSIMRNPSIDPHTFEVSTRDALAVAGARLVVQNGDGYDAFMGHLESASPTRGRVVVVVNRVVNGSKTPRNPHLWYSPATMPQLATVVARDLGRLDPGHAAAFRRAAQRFIRSLAPWTRAIAQIRSRFHGAKVAVSEPVANYLLKALGLTVATPWGFQAAVMNSLDPSPQDVTIQDALLTHRRVRLLVYNRQAVGAATATLQELARAHRIPIVAAYETMPTAATYQSWMLKETTAIQAALVNGRSTLTLP